jgi:hypothetical protein
MKRSYSKIYKLLFLFCILLSEYSTAQTISNVRFLGLSRTKYSYLRDHIVKSKAGDAVDTVQIKKDVQEIYNLRHFSSVQYQLISIDSNYSELYFILVETFSMFPVLDVGLTKDFIKIQAGVVDFNTFGRSGNSNLYVRRLGRMTYIYSGDYPFVLGGKNGIAADIHKIGTYEPLYFNNQKNEFSYDVYTLLLMHRYDINLHSFTKVGIGYQYETFSPQTYTNLPLEYPLKASADRLLIRANYRYTFINLNRINQKGVYLDLSYNEVKSNAKENRLFGDSKRLLSDVRYYFNIYKQTNLAVRLRAGIGKSAFFDQFVLDDNTNIRGIGFKRVRRDYELVLNFETRQIIYEHRLGILQAALFNDFSPGYNFLGGGLRAYLEPIHGVVIRCDYGFNSADPKQGGIVAGIHQYF